MADAELQRLVVRFEADISKLQDKIDKIPGIVNRAARGVDNAGLGRSLDRTFSPSRVGVMDAMATRLPGMSGGLSALGAAGIAAGVAMAGTAAAIEAVTAAAKKADALKSSADAIGVTAEKLQELRFAAAEFSIGANETDRAIQNLNAALGAMRSGVGDGKLKEAFEALGISQEDLNSISTVSELLPVIASHLQAVGNQAEQVQLARKLGIEDLLPLLRQGGDQLETLTRRARDLGIVMSEEVVASMAATNRELELADQRVSIAGQRMSSVLAPAATTVKNAFADATVALADFIGWLAKLGGANAAANLDEATANLATAERELEVLRRTNGGMIGSQLSPAARANILRRGEEKVEAARAAVRAATGAGGVVGGVPTGNGFAVTRGGGSSSNSAGGGGGNSRMDSDHWEYDDTAGVWYYVVVDASGVVASRTPWNNREGVGVGAIPGTGGVQGDIRGVAPQNVDGLTTPGADAAAGVQAAEDDMRETFRASFRDGVVAALHGDLKEFLIQSLANAVTKAFEDSLNQIADMLFGAFRSAMSGASGGANWGNAIASFAGFKAAGGPIGPGQWGIAGENGPEPVFGGMNGVTVGSRSGLQNLATGRGGGAVVVNQFTLHSPVVTQDLIDQMEAIGNRSKIEAVGVSRALAGQDAERAARMQSRRFG